MDGDDENPTPHEHAVNEAPERNRNGLAQEVALMTATLSTFGALVEQHIRSGHSGFG